MWLFCIFTNRKLFSLLVNWTPCWEFSAFCKIRTLKLDTDVTMVSYDVTSRFTCILTSDTVTTVRQDLVRDDTFSDRTQLSPDHICTQCLSDHHLFPIQKKLLQTETWHCSLVSPIVAKIYMEEGTARPWPVILWISPQPLVQVDDTWAKIKTK